MGPLSDDFGLVRFTADDVGISHAIDDAIYKLCKLRIVSTVAVISNGRCLESASRFGHLGAEITVHLNLTYGRPVCRPIDVRSLVEPSGNFRVPMHYASSSDTSPLDAVRRYQSEALESINENEVIREFRAQRLACANAVKLLSSRCSIHHDLDKSIRIRKALERVWPEFPSRQLELSMNRICGYGYILSGPGEAVAAYEARFVDFVRQAAVVSRDSGGTAYEIAVHPAEAPFGYDDFTIYTTGRVTEFHALLGILSTKVLTQFDDHLCAWRVPIPK